MLKMPSMCIKARMSLLVLTLRLLLWIKATPKMPRIKTNATATANPLNKSTRIYSEIY